MWQLINPIAVVLCWALIFIVGWMYTSSVKFNLKKANQKLARGSILDPYNR